MNLARRYFLKLLGLAPLALVVKPEPVTFGLMWSLEPGTVSFDQPADWGKVVGGVLFDDSVNGAEIMQFDFVEPLQVRLHP